VLVALLLWPRLGGAGRALVVALGAILAVGVGLTRVALLAHWPSDVLGGWLLGVAVVPALALAFAGRTAGAGTRARDGDGDGARPTAQRANS
jgi:undecaprenyl-diphosphatase